MRFGKSAKGEWLAWRATRNHVNKGVGLEIKFSHISLMYEAGIEVRTEAFTSLPIEFNQPRMRETGSFQTFSQSTASSEQF